MNDKKFVTFADKPKTMRDMRFVGENVKLVKNASSTSIASNSSIPSKASIASITSSSSVTSRGTKWQSEISPTKNYQKVPNSVTQNLDLFKGKSKQVWDFIWLKTRAAVNASRSVRLSRAEIKHGAALGSFVTVDAAIEHLTNIGLLKVNKVIGSLKGNEYEIFSPDEIDLTSTSISSISSKTSLAQKVDILAHPESSISSRTQSVENKDTSEAANTSFKDIKNNDDEPFGGFIEKMSEAFEKVSGKRPRKSDKAKLNELAELLIMELEIAAARTGSVSNVPAFLTEHLRRRLTNAINKTANAVTKTAKPTTKTANPTNKTESAPYEAEPLTEQGREQVLKTFREKIEKGEREYIMSLRETYTKEDWHWLMSELEK